MNKFNQFFKDMGYSYMVDNTFVNIFRAIFWISIVILGIYLFFKGLWIIDTVFPNAL